MAIRPAGRPLPAKAPPKKPFVEVRFLVDRKMDAALRSRVRKQNTTRAAHLRNLIERDLDENRSAAS
jgi:hypothetical protein